MADLKTLFEEMGASDVTTYIQSGNVIFKHKNLETSNLGKLISENIASKLGLVVTVIVFTKAELSEAFNNNPFVENAEIEQLHLTFLSDEPTAEKLTAINLLSYPPDEFRIIGKSVYLKCVNKYHQTKLSNNFFEKKLGVAASTRNWKTMTKLVELAED